MSAGWKRWPPTRGALLLPADAREAAAAAVALEASCRPAALLARRLGAGWIERVGAAAVPGPAAEWEPPLAPDEWDALLAALRDVAGPFGAFAVWERRQPRRRGFGLLLHGPRGPAAFVKLRPAPADGLRTERQVLERAGHDAAYAFRFPAVLGTGRAGAWRWVAISVIPPFHHPPADPKLGMVAADVQRLLRDLPRPPGTPPHWLPMHGDLTPWNLREDAVGRLWLYDWERAAWAPPGADAVLYRASAAAIGLGPAATAMHACAEWPEAAAFWAERMRSRDAAGRGERRLRRRMLALLGAARIGSRDAELAEVP
jgi:hypothetical protein